jgi:site-specific DNA-methyltransferase (adenine-specific)
MLHPAQKPVELLEQLIKDSTNEGDNVLDCFMGSGSTMEACIKTKRNGIGIELSEDYFNISKKRVENFNKSFNQPTLFNAGQ